ncbi:MAG: carboxypeptidase regulatory-like domain-containing protein [Planctomycetes bacterium]|nr:carboxypeptidase regulatory-like domain-containing protein [Planctomycetota bacterium]
MIKIRRIALLLILFAAIAAILVYFFHGDEPRRTAESIPASKPNITIPDARVPASTPSTARTVEKPASEPAAPRTELLTLKGRVVDELGAPIESANLSTADGERLFEFTNSAADGSFSIDTKLNGNITVEARKFGWISAKRAIDTNAAGVFVIELVLARAPRLRIRFLTLYDEPLLPKLKELGIPVDDHTFRVLATKEPFTRPVPEYTGIVEFGDGWYRTGPCTIDGILYPLPEGFDATLDVTARLPSYITILFARKPIASQRADVGQEEVIFRISPDEFRANLGSVRMKLISPFPSIPIRDNSVATAWGAVGTPQTSGYPDADDIINITDIPPGNYLIECLQRRQGGVIAAASLPAAVGRGEITNLGDVRLLPPIHIYGRVVDESGQPMKLGELGGFGFSPVDSDATRMAGRVHGLRTGTDGKFTINSASPGQYDIRQYGALGNACKLIDATAGSVENVEFVVRKSFELQVIAHGGVEGEYYHLCIADATGAPVFNAPVTRGYQSKYTFPPGNYTYTIVDANDAKVTRSFTIERAPSKLEFELDK